MAKENTSTYYVQESTTRLIALQVVVILFLVFFGHWTFLAYILTVDFAIRGFTYLRSPLNYIAKSVSKVLGLRPKPIFATPKKFAALLGFVFSLAISVSLSMDLEVFAYVVGGILAFFAFLEAVFNLCIGCYIYNWLVAPIISAGNNRNRQKTTNDSN